MEYSSAFESGYDVVITKTIQASAAKKQKSFAWQKEIRQSVQSAGKGQVLVVNFTGDIQDNYSQGTIIDNICYTAEKVCEAGASVVELDMSQTLLHPACLKPLCFHTLTKKVRGVVGDRPLMVKVGYFEDDFLFQIFVESIHEHIDAINSINSTYVSYDREEHFPGNRPLTVSLENTSYKYAGLTMTRKLKQIRTTTGGNFLIGVSGGVTDCLDYLDYKNEGADVVFSAKGAMQNPYLVQDIKEMVLRGA
jgi:dihydroorotate dehydrogenase